VIGESLKRITRFLGYDVLGDIHLGDWGLQMGMIVSELRLRQPDLSYFDDSYSGPYPDESPIRVADLERIYPAASEHSKVDPEFMAAARQATYELQQGRAAYSALWRHFVNVSIAAMKKSYKKLGVEFDLWLGESDVQERIPPMIARLVERGDAVESQGATIIPNLTDNGRELPPLLLVKSDGATLYGTTDLATIEQRVQELNAEIILYVVDARQSDHFRQVFDAARKTGIAPVDLHLEHIGFGTVLGTDRKPLKSREGEAPKLEGLIRKVNHRAREQIEITKMAEEYTSAEKAKIAKVVGIAALKFSDLINEPYLNYVFDIDRFTSFEGRTGPYILYAVARIKSILRKAAKRRLKVGPMISPISDLERALLLTIAKFPDTLQEAFESRAPNILANYVYELAKMFNDFYQKQPVLREENPARRASLLAVSQAVTTVLAQGLNLLGIEVLERM
jgi:arginyl-tRNA synthetase